MASQASRKTDGRGRLYDSIVDTVGDTPCIRLNRIAPKHVRLYVKAEFFNPAASVKAIDKQYYDELIPVGGPDAIGCMRPQQARRWS